MFKELNPLLHSELRLAVISILIGVEEADFVFLRQETGATAGNLSVQLDKLARAGYIEIEKGFRGILPRKPFSIPLYPALASLSSCTERVPAVAPVSCRRTTKSASSPPQRIERTASRGPD